MVMGFYPFLNALTKRFVGFYPANRIPHMQTIWMDNYANCWQRSTVIWSSMMMVFCRVCVRGVCDFCIDEFHASRVWAKPASHSDLWLVSHIHCQYRWVFVVSTHGHRVVPSNRVITGHFIRQPYNNLSHVSTISGNTRQTHT